jgi:hypothetical protein
VTLRDEAWNIALIQIVKSGKFQLTDLPFKESERHTVRRVLREMEAYGWLERESEYASVWRAGEMAEMLMNLSEEKLELAKA